MPDLAHDPVPTLLAHDNAALRYFVLRDLLGESVPGIETVWELPEVRKCLRGQQPDGSWPRKRSQPDVYPVWHYPLFETWKRLRVLVQQYELTVAHSTCRTACEFILSCQTDAGDIRGMLANQYTTYYTGALTYLLVRAGLGGDPRVIAALEWLLGMRQDDGGWTVAMGDHGLGREEQHCLSTEYAAPLEPVRSRPFTHLATGMVLRAFAVHPEYRVRREIRHAGALLESRFFECDTTSSYRAAAYWTVFSWPYWWNDLAAALDTLRQIGFDASDPDIAAGLRWFAANQRQDGLWDLASISGRVASGPKGRLTRAWVGLNIARILRAYSVTW